MATFEENKMKAFKAIAEASLKLYREGLVGGTAGNVSMRIPESDLIAITPSTIPYERYDDPSIMCVVDLDGNQIEGEYVSTSETPMHTILLKELPHVNAIVHTHSPYATGIAGCNGAYVPVMNLEGVRMGAPQIHATEGYIRPGSPDLGKAVLDTLAKDPGAKIVLLQNHGVVTFGATIDEAMSLAHRVENNAQNFFIAKMMEMAHKIDLIFAEKAMGSEEKLGMVNELTQQDRLDTLNYYEEKKRIAKEKNAQKGL